MKRSPPPVTATTTAWSSSKPPLLRFLHMRATKNSRRKPAARLPTTSPSSARPTLPILASASRTLDGHVYEVGDTRVPFTIQSMSKPFVFALALDTLGASGWRA